VEAIVTVRLYLTPDPGLRHITVETVALGADAERKLVGPLVAFLRTQRPWAGPDRLTVTVQYPSAIEDAFRPATTIVAAEQLEEAAALQWSLLGGEWKAPVPWFAWIADFRLALTNHLRDLAREHPELPFP
jgi:hypothetical protein